MNIYSINRQLRDLRERLDDIDEWLDNSNDYDQLTRIVMCLNSTDIIEQRIIKLRDELTRELVDKARQAANQ